MDVKIGDKVWFIDYSGVCSGVVLDIADKGTFGTKVACVRDRLEFKSVEIDSRKVWLTQHECVLALAERKQQEASRLLSEAAGLFKQGGGMKQTEEDAE